MKGALREAVGESAAQLKLRSQHFEMPVPWDDLQGQPQWWSGDSQSLEYKLCVLQRWGQRNDLSPLEEPRR